MKVIFFGSSDYCLSILEILSINFQLITIITKRTSSVQGFALKNKIKVFTPKDKTELLNLISQIRQIKPDLAIVSDYGLIIPKEIFTLPKYKTLNIHFSKLPKFRGPSPVQYTILMGEKSAYISVIIMDEEIDTGDIVWQKEITSFNIQHLTFNIENETTESLYRKLFNIIAVELPDIVNKYINGELKPQKQDHSQATYTKHLTREDGFIPPLIIKNAMQGLATDQKQLSNWRLAIKIPKLSIINCQLSIAPAIRALSPWPGLWTYISLAKSGQDTPGVEESEKTNKKRLKILKAHLQTDPNQVRKAKPNLVRKVLVLVLVQLEGKKPVTWRQFREGYPDFSF